MVDNGSRDGSFEFVQRNYPRVHIIGLSKNFGFAYAVNRGIDTARGEFIALLNNDTDLDDHWLEHLVSAISNDANLGSVACRMLNFFDRTLIDSAGDEMSPFTSIYNRGHGEKDGDKFSRRKLVFGACAGAALYRRTVFQQIGMFDEDFVSFYEDVDFSLRSQMAGFKCLYVPEAICYHKRGATGGKGSAYPVKMTERNLMALYAKSFPAGLFFPKLPFILGGTIRRIYRAARNEMGIPAIKGFFLGLALLPRMLKKRSRVQRLRKVQISYLKSIMSRKE